MRARVGAGGGLLWRTRLVMLAFTLLLALVAAVEVAFAEVSVPLRVAVVGALAAVSAWWIRGYRRGGFVAGSEFVEVLVLMLAAVVIGDLVRSLGMVYAALAFRSMYGGRVALVVRILLYIACVVGTAAIVDGGLTDGGLTGGEIGPALGNGPTLAGWAVLSHLFQVALHHNVRAVAREHLLAAAGTALQAAPGRADIHQVAVDSAVRLAGTAGAQAALLLPRNDSLTVVATTGSIPTGQAVTLPPLAEAELEGTRSAYSEGPGLAGLDGLFAGRSTARGLLLVPLVVAGERYGVLALASARSMAADVRASVETLAAQVVLRLGSAALTEQLTDLAFRDALTGLPNRALLREALAVALARHRRGKSFGLLLLDLDGFRQTNDSLGHEAGDAVLVAVADRLRGCVRDSDTIGRLGGDEFAIVVNDIDDAQGAVLAAQRILTAFQEPAMVGAQQVRIRASVGIVLPAGEEEPSELLRHADVAMYRAKRRGTSSYELYEMGVHAAALGRLQLKDELERALPTGQLTVHYQPIVTLDTGVIHGVEALVRWRHPTRGMVSPSEFIPLAEESGMIVQIGAWVLERACRQASAWQQLPGWGHLELSVNLSARQLDRANLVDDVTRILAETGLRHGTLVLELTESSLLHESDESAARLAVLRERGVRIALDDFGTGYSSLSYLDRLPIDILKIDRSFVARVGDRDRTALTEVIIKLSQALRLETVAEGIEMQDQLDELRKLGCLLGQGYLLAKPVEPELVEAMLRRPARAG